MITDILIWLSLATPIVLILYVIYRLLSWGADRWHANYVHTDPPADYVEPETTLTTTARKPTKPNPNDPAPLKELNVGEEPVKWVSIDEQSFLQDDEEEVGPVEAGVRIWRVYRSIDGDSWVELDPALTERSACNYASYIKRLNPTEFVRVNDPDGITVSYE